MIKTIEKNQKLTGFGARKRLAKVIKQSDSFKPEPTETVTFLVALYNKEKYFSACLESLIREQKLLQAIGIESEVIVVNDASTDESINILQLYQEKLKNLTLISLKRNIGRMRATRLGIEQISTKWFQIVDSDDMLIAGIIQRHLAIIHAFGVDAVCGSCFDSFDAQNNKFDVHYSISSEVTKNSPAPKKIILMYHKPFSKMQGVANFFPTRLMKDNLHMLKDTLISQEVPLNYMLTEKLKNPIALNRYDILICSPRDSHNASSSRQVSGKRDYLNMQEARYYFNNFKKEANILSFVSQYGLYSLFKMKKKMNFKLACAFDYLLPETLGDFSKKMKTQWFWFKMWFAPIRLMHYQTAIFERAVRKKAHGELRLTFLEPRIKPEEIEITKVN